MARCKACDDPIRFVKSASTGRPMPLNVSPDPTGNVTISDGRAHVLAGDELAAAREAGATLYLSHYATCPHAGDFRRST